MGSVNARVDAFEHEQGRQQPFTAAPARTGKVEGSPAPDGFTDRVIVGRAHA
jgi:hypothetical protein